MKYFDNLSLMAKMFVMTVPLIILIIVTTIIDVTDVREGLLNEHKTLVMEVTNSANSILESYCNKTVTGEMDEEAAKTAAYAAIKAIRYDDGIGYIFLVKKDGTAITVGNPALAGKNVMELRDPTGFAFFREMMNIAEQKGEGYVSYLWKKPNTGTEQPFPKLSFVKNYENWGIVLGSGVYLDEVDREVNKKLTESAIIIIPIMVMSLFLLVLISRRVTRPILSLADVMNELDKGNLSCDVGYTTLKNEIGEIALAIQSFKNNLIKINELEKEQEELKIQAREDQKQKLLDLAAEFESRVSEITKSVAGTAIDVAQAAAIMSNNCESASKQSIEVLSMTRQTNMNAQAVSAATEELSASIQEINSQVSEATRVANMANSKTRETMAIVETLDVAVNKIGEVIQFIGTIASQTRLLALNATIEAARAGDAGKGFAVVANEVKTLALQTSNATEDISKNIQEVQQATKNVVAAVSDVETTVGDVNQISTIIAAAIEEQGAATNEISRNVTEVSNSSAYVETHMGDVTKSVEHTGNSSQRVLDDATQMSELANDLLKKVNDFIEYIRKTA